MLTSLGAEGEVLPETVYFDELTGLYYDQYGNLIELNPDEYNIEEIVVPAATLEYTNAPVTNDD